MSFMNFLQKTIPYYIVFFLIAFCNYIQTSFSDKDLVILVTTYPISFEQWLQQNMYKMCNKIVIRPILSMPTYNVFNLNNDTNECLISFSLFYSGIFNGTYFSSCQKEITSILDVGEFSDYTNDIFEYLFSNTHFANFNFPLLGDLFDYVIVRQHRLGGVLSGSMPLTCALKIFIQAPILYHINHIHCDEETQERFNDEITTLYYGNNNTQGAEAINDPAQDFIKNSFVFDYFGIESIHMGLLYKLYSSCNCEINLQGGIMTPGSIFKEGIIGENLQNQKYFVTNFSLMTLAKNVIHYGEVSSETYAQIMSLFSGLCKSLTDGSFATRPSDNPWKLSCGTSMTLLLTPGITGILDNRLFFSFPNTVVLYGFTSINPSLFLDNYNNITDAEASKIVTFFDQQFLQRILLQPFIASRDSSWEWESFLGISIDLQEYAFTTGLDLWIMGSQNTRFSHKFDERGFLYNAESLFFSQSPTAAQLKLYFEFNILSLSCNENLQCNIKSEISLFSHGIGYEHGISGELVFTF